jgi:protoheme IX farnesyltransferase
MNMKRVKVYYSLVKPGLVYGNIFTTLGGFFFASRGHIVWGLLVAVVMGTGLVIGSACVFNNYYDRNIDRKMNRTKHRAIVEGLVSKMDAMVYGSVLGLIGLALLILFTHLHTVLVGLVGFLVYVFWYTRVKHTSMYSTLIGTIPGATPILAGYVAVSNRFDTIALLLFLILVFWQMVHFYSIGIYRYGEYKAAEIPILPVVRGIPVAKRHILFYLIGFIAATVFLGVVGGIGALYLIVVSLLGLNWIRIYMKGFAHHVDETKWAKKMFLYSLVVLMSFSFLICFDYARLVI